MHGGARGWGIALVVACCAGAGCSGDDTTTPVTSAAGAEPVATAASVVTSPTATTAVTVDATAPPTTWAGTSLAPGDSAPAPPTTSAAAGGPPPPAPWVYPGDAWATIDPTAAGLDPAALDALRAEAESAGSSCTAVVRDGTLVAADSWGPLGPDEPREAWSVTKSVTSTLVGIAQDHGFLTIADRVSTYVPEWQGTASEEVTIRDILANASGRHWALDTDYVDMAFRAEDKTAFAIGLGQDAEPGTVWAYNNSAIQVLDAVLEAATGESPAAFAERTLFGPIGMHDSHLATDAVGNTMMFAGLKTTCHDLARFGYLILRNGEWAGTQIVSADYVWRATREPSTEINAAYGWLWWLNRRGPIASTQIATTGVDAGSAPVGQFMAGESEDTFWALGLFEQIVAVVPTEDLVAVRMGDKPPDDAPFGPAEFTGAVLQTVVEHRPS